MMNFLKDWIIQYQNKFLVGGAETTIDRITGTVLQKGDTISAAYLNEIQKNCIYQVNATRVIEGVLEIYDISIDWSEEFTPFNQTFLIDFSATNTQVDSLLRFNGNTYSLRFSDSITNGDIVPKIGFIPKRALVKLDVTNSKAIVVSSLDFSEETINFTGATGTVSIPSGLPIGTKKLIRKLNATQGTVTITCIGEKFTPSNLSSVTLNADGDFWLVEKVNATRWDLVDGKESGSNGNGNYLKKFSGEAMAWMYGSAGVTTGTWNFPITFKSLPKSTSSILDGPVTSSFMLDIHKITTSSLVYNKLYSNSFESYSTLGPAVVETVRFEVSDFWF